MTYRKIGGLHHFRLWRFGLSWYWSPKAKAKTRPFDMLHLLRD